MPASLPPADPCDAERRWEGPRCWVGTTYDQLVECRDQLLEVLHPLSDEIERRRRARAELQLQ